jgi:glycosyltransferase involved in cell wall biosynthesis
MTGFLVEPGNPLDLAAHLGLILQDRVLRARMAAAARRRAVERYDWHTIGAQLEAAYAKALESVPTAESGPSRKEGMQWQA